MMNNKILLGFIALSLGATHYASGMDKGKEAKPEGKVGQGTKRKPERPTILLKRRKTENGSVTQKTQVDEFYPQQKPGKHKKSSCVFKHATPGSMQPLALELGQFESSGTLEGVAGFDHLLTDEAELRAIEAAIISAQNDKTPEQLTELEKTLAEKLKQQRENARLLRTIQWN